MIGRRIGLNACPEVTFRTDSAITEWIEDLGADMDEFGVAHQLDHTCDRVATESRFAKMDLVFGTGEQPRLEFGKRFRVQGLGLSLIDRFARETVELIFEGWFAFNSA